MKHREYSQKLVWQRLKRDRTFIEWLKTRDLALKKEIEEKYRAFDLRISKAIPVKENPHIMEEDLYFVWINPSFVRILTPVYESYDNPDLPRKIQGYRYGPRQPLSTKIAFEIDLEKFSWIQDYKELKDEIQAEIEAEMRLMTPELGAPGMYRDEYGGEEWIELDLGDQKLGVPFNDTKTPYRPRDFDRDLAILESWEQDLMGKGLEKLAQKHGFKSISAVKKRRDAIYELLYGVKYERRKHVYRAGLPCDGCPDKSVQCSSGCPKMRLLLYTTDEYGMTWDKQMVKSDVNIADYLDREVLDEYSKSLKDEE